LSWIYTFIEGITLKLAIVKLKGSTFRVQGSKVGGTDPSDLLKCGV
jgi:hypothetical protein